MKYHLLFSILILTGCRVQYQPLYTAEELAHARKYPYEVLYAESCKTSSGFELSGWSELPADDTLILDNGYVLLSNYAGQFYEFEGDTTFSLRSLNNQLDSINVDRIQRFKFLVDTTFKNAPYFGGSTHKWNGLYWASNLDPFYIGSVVQMKRETPICLTWYSDRSDYDVKAYSIIVKNILEDIVWQKRVTGNSFELRLTDWEKEENKQDMYIVQVSELEGDLSTRMIGLKIVGYDEPNNICLPKSPREHLNFAVIKELFMVNIGAEGEYRMAKNLSNRRIYQQIYLNFLKRHPDHFRMD